MQAVRITVSLLSTLALLTCTFNQVTHYNNPKLLAEVSENLGEAMVGLTMYALVHLSFLTSIAHDIPVVPTI